MPSPVISTLKPSISASARVHYWKSAVGQRMKASSHDINIVVVKGLIPAPNRRFLGTDLRNWKLVWENNKEKQQ